MTDISVIILQKNEKLHIGRCLERLMPLEPRQVFVVDSPSTDGSDKIAAAMGATVVVHEYPGNQAAQFQWALENLPIKAKWILRLDADEYLLAELIAEIKEKLPRIPEAVAGVVLKRRNIVGWLNNAWVRRGIYPTRILRLFRFGRGRSDMKLMDEHIVVDGATIEFENDFVDHSLISFADWQAKHRDYAKREAQSYQRGEKSTGEMAAKKETYYRLPRYVRAVMYFCIRYFLKGGLLDGAAGWRWNFWQGLWYRCLVDYEIGKIRKHVLS